MCCNSLLKKSQLLVEVVVSEVSVRNGICQLSTVGCHTLAVTVACTWNDLPSRITSSPLQHLTTTKNAPVSSVTPRF